MNKYQSFFFWGTIRAIVVTPFVLALAAFGNDPKAVAVAIQGGVGVGDVISVVQTIPAWPLVVVIAVVVGYIGPYLGRVEGAGDE